MLKSYLAIVDRSGLRSLCEEQEGASELLACRLHFADLPPSLLVWAVVSDDVIRSVRGALRCENRYDAWRILQSESQQIGSVATAAQPLLRA